MFRWGIEWGRTALDSKVRRREVSTISRRRLCRETFATAESRFHQSYTSRFLFVSRDCKLLVSRRDIQQVFTCRNHSEKNGQAERWGGVMRQDALRPACPMLVSLLGVCEDLQ